MLCILAAIKGKGISSLPLFLVTSIKAEWKLQKEQEQHATEQLMKAMMWERVYCCVTQHPPPDPCFRSAQHLPLPPRLDRNDQHTIEILCTFLNENLFFTFKYGSITNKFFVNLFSVTFWTNKDFLFGSVNHLWACLLLREVNYWQTTPLT